MNGSKKLAEQGRRRVEIKVSGMTCATCATTIENSLMGQKGVHEARVNLGKETATVEYESGKVRLPELEKAITDSGYQVINERAAIKVGGMVCAMCVSTVEDALRGLEGVSDISVNLASERAYVSYNPRVTSIGEIRKAIEGSGYTYLGMVGEESGDMEAQARERDLGEKWRRIMVGAAASLILMALMYLPEYHMVMGIPMGYLMLVLCTPPFVYVSYPIFKAASRALRNRNLNMDVMYSMGIGVAFLSSLFGTVGIVLTPDFMFYETAVMLATFLTLGRYLETRAKGRTTEAIKSLVGLQPHTATLLVEGREVETPIEEVAVGDVILVRPGEKVPVDGQVLEGTGYVNEAMITGEPNPLTKAPGSEVVGGTINGNTSFSFRATRVGRDTVLAQIIDLVDQAQGSRPPIQRIADRVVAYFIPTVLTVALSTFVIWYWFLGQTLLFSLTALISVLVVACPCALGLATPTAVTVGLGRGAELGILIKSGEALEACEGIGTVVFDKTGTLTVGRPEVTDVLPLEGPSEETLALGLAAEKNSEHPLAAAVVRKGEDKGLVPPEIRDFKALPGKGVTAILTQSYKTWPEGTMLAVGNRSLLADTGISLGSVPEEAALGLESEGKTVVFVSLGQEVKGIIAVADLVKDDALQAVRGLRDLGLDVMMITGDNPRSARAVAERIGIDKVLAEVLPEDKAREISRLQEGGERAAFVGDGINDAPALAQADVGVAIGSGTDVALETGGIVLIRDRLMDVVAAIQLGRKVMSRIKLNIFWAFAYNLALIPVAAGVLYPSFGITFRPELAGLAMALSSVTVVTLSLLLKRYIPPARRDIY